MSSKRRAYEAYCDTYDVLEELIHRCYVAIPNEDTEVYTWDIIEEMQTDPVYKEVAQMFLLIIASESESYTKIDTQDVADMKFVLDEWFISHAVVYMEHLKEHVSEEFRSINKLPRSFVGRLNVVLEAYANDLREIYSLKDDPSQFEVVMKLIHKWCKG